MPNYVVSDTNLTSIASAIRTKGGTSGALSFPDGFVSAISAISGGGGGTINFVTGEFNVSTSYAPYEINIPYTGNGYPVAVLVTVKNGIAGDTTFSRAIQRYAYGLYVVSKTYVSDSPRYAGRNIYDAASILYARKSSDTDYSYYENNFYDNEKVYKSDTSSSQAGGRAIIINSPTKMSVFIGSAGIPGFMANIDYTYHIIYSN